MSKILAEQLLAGIILGDKNLISLGLEGKAKMAVGVNLGVMWDINEQWSLGFTYRSKLKMKGNILSG